MRMLLHEVLTEMELRVKSERLAHEQRMDRLARIATHNKPSALGVAWASVSTGLSRLVKRGSEAVRQALQGGSQPSEECR